MKNFVEEIRWRGLLHSITPEAESFLKSNKTKGYIGFDPTSNSLHIGNLMQLIILKHFQNAGHQPVIVVGGATGMIGDPSGKSKERNLLTEEQLQFNIKGMLSQIEKYLDFQHSENHAILVNNYDWMKSFGIIDFVRDVGKYITVNYMMAKDSVKKRVEEGSEGMSFTEFTYQLFQGYDFLHLYENIDCKLQMGGSDQWGNIITGIDLIKKRNGGKAHGLTTVLVEKSDGSKFGKTEAGNIWLDSEKTSVYKFYQYWINLSDEDIEKGIRLFTFLDKSTVETLISEHRKTPHLRLLQKTLAREITAMVHSKEELQKAEKASNMLFGKSTKEELASMDEEIFNEVFEGVPTVILSISELEQNMTMVEALSAKTSFLSSNSEATRCLKSNAISVNKQKIDVDYTISKKDLINGKYILLQKGKKQYFVLKYSEN